jgi:FG-GAP repeat
MNITKRLTVLMAIAALAACGSGDDTNSVDSGNAGGAGGGGSPAGVIYSAQAYLKAANATDHSFYGTAIAISGDTVVVGAYNQGTGANRPGGAYVLKRTGTSWAQEAYLTASNAEHADRFGTSVSISGDTIVVGAICESSSLTTIRAVTGFPDNNNSGCSGAAYVFKRTGTVWAQEAYLKASNANALNDPLDPTSGYLTAVEFGWSVAVSGDTIVVGAINEASPLTTITNGAGAASLDTSAFGSGAAFVYKRSAGPAWAQQAYIKAPNAESSDGFGNSMALSGDTLVIGASNEESNQTTITNVASANNSATGAGAAYVFSRTGNAWSFNSYLKAPNAEAADQFGYSLALSGDTIVVGANLESSNQTTITNGTTASANNGAASAGAAYVFRLSGGNWTNEAYLKPSNAHAGDQFGISVAIYSDTIVVGAYAESSNQRTLSDGTTASSDHSAAAAGAAYVFKRTGATWAQEAYLKAPNADAGDQFGTSVGVYSNTVVVGAPWEKSAQTTITNGITASADNSLTGVGAAYVFLHQ